MSEEYANYNYKMPAAKSKQTAVEWLEEKVRNFNDRKQTHYEYDQMFKQAKEMEKQQIIDAFGVGCQVESTRLIGYHGMAEQYYIENYGGNK